MPLIVADLILHTLVSKSLPIHENLLQISADTTIYLTVIAAISFLGTPNLKDKGEVYMRKGRRTLLWIQLTVSGFMLKLPLIVVGWATYKWLGY